MHKVFFTNKKQLNAMVFTKERTQLLFQRSHLFSLTLCSCWMFSCWQGGKTISNNRRIVSVLLTSFSVKMEAAIMAHLTFFMLLKEIFPLSDLQPLVNLRQSTFVDCLCHCFSWMQLKYEDDVRVYYWLCLAKTALNEHKNCLLKKLCSY